MAPIRRSRWEIVTAANFNSSLSEKMDKCMARLHQFIMILPNCMCCALELHIVPFASRKEINGQMKITDLFLSE